jgi:hypothetical protein
MQSQYKIQLSLIVIKILAIVKVNHHPKSRFGGPLICRVVQKFHLMQWIWMIKKGLEL